MLIPIMAPIQILDQTLIDQIAAGEVIVQPASVVKELVENAIDAKASRITVLVDKDCRQIRVGDDGIGIAPSEVGLSIRRHATSKIGTFDDLTQVRTRGFRGEALASIVAVSRFEIASRPSSSAAGIRLRAEGGKNLDIRPIGCPPGTTVEVRDLFFNTPARLKFMKTPGSEWSAIQTVLTRQALASPEVGFSVYRAEKPVWETPPRQSLSERIAHLFGASTAESMIEVSQNSDRVEYAGWIGRPGTDRADRRQQFFMVNGRPIVSTRLSAVLLGAYKGLIMTRRFPIAVLNIALDPDLVDVNVHPTKEEVRFTNERKIAGLLHRALTGSLRGANFVPTFSSAAPAAEGAGAKPDPTMDLLFGTQKRKADSTWPPPPGQSAGSAEEPGWPPSVRTAQPPPPPGRETSFDIPETVNSPAEAAQMFDGEKPAPVGQVGDSYIIAECGDGVLLIDQHAAHERLLYHRFKQRLRRPDIQPLMIPTPFQPAPADTATLEELIPHFKALGIEIENFGGRDYVVQAVPVDFAEIDIAKVIQDLLDSFHGKGVADPDETVRDKVITRMACHAAIKAGQKLAREEMARLIDDVIEANLSFTCPHGRPTMILMTKDHLDRQFKRK
jgi:DNA mismatch repair protein MutL